jgi:hypothetical protein
MKVNIEFFPKKLRFFSDVDRLDLPAFFVYHSNFAFAKRCPDGMRILKTV